MRLVSPADRHPSRARAAASVLVLVCFFLSQTACLTTSVPPVGAEPSFKPENDERRLWEQSRQEERKLRDKATLYRDPILEDYLNQVARRLEPPEVRQQETIKIRVYPIQDPTLNAFTYPTGSIYVHTGLLAPGERGAAGHRSRTRDDPRHAPARPGVRAQRAQQDDRVLDRLARRQHRGGQRGGP